MIFAIKKTLLFIPLIIIAVAVLFVSPWNSRLELKKPPIAVESLSDQTLELRDSLSASIDSLKNLKPEVARAIIELKEYKAQVKEIEQQEADIVIKKVVDSSALMALRKKLNSANSEISRLNNVLAIERTYKNYSSRYNEVSSYVQPPVETPDDNSIVVSLDGTSRRGGEVFVPQNLIIYLIPYNKSVKKYANYESSCGGELSGYRSASYYKGVYFFNSVQAGKYLIKICTYFGNYKVIDKGSGKYNITMQISPPIQ